MWDGRVRSEEHRHYGADGTETGRTVVFREPEVTESDRLDVRAGLRHKRSRCPSCGATDSWVELVVDMAGGYAVADPGHVPAQVRFKNGHTALVRRMQCMGCAAVSVMDDAHRELTKDRPAEETAGVRHFVEDIWHGRVSDGNPP